MDANDILELKDWRPKDVWWGFNMTSWNFTVPICKEPDEGKPTLIGVATPPWGNSPKDRIGLQFGNDGQLYITHARAVSEEGGRKKCKFYSMAIGQKELTLPKEICLALIKDAIIRVIRYQD